MSSYLCFYLRVNDMFAPIGTFSRNTEMYQNFRHLPYAKMRALRSSEIREEVNQFESLILNYAKIRKNYEDDIALIMNAENNTLEEKLECVDGVKQCINEADEIVAELVEAKHYLRALLEMIDAFQYGGDTDNEFENDFNHYIYAGIEVTGAKENVVGE